MAAKRLLNSFDRQRWSTAPFSPPFCFFLRHPFITKLQYYPDGELAADATANARRYARLAAEAADAAMPPPTRGDLPDDVFDVLQRQVRSCF
jgi:hypothetical protein